MGNSFMTDYEKMIDFCTMPKSEFLKFYSYLSEDDYKETIHDVLNTSGYWHKEWLEDNPDFDGTVLKDIILGLLITDWLKTKNDIKYVWILNGFSDEGNWEVEIFDSYNKALKYFNNYISEYTDNYSNCKWDNEKDFAHYESGSHYGSFWIEKIEVR